MTRLGIRIKILKKSVTERVAEISKSGSHKYVKREGTPGNYKYYYRLPDGSLGSKEDLKAITKNGGGDQKKPSMPGNRTGNKQPKQNVRLGIKTGGGSGSDGNGNGGGNGGVFSGNVAVGDVITGKEAGTGKELSGKVTAKGKDGVTILDENDILHHVPWDGIKSAGGRGKGWVPPDEFTAEEWKKQWDDPKANKDDAGVDHIMNSFETLKEEIERHIKKTDAKNYELIYTKQLTHQTYRKSGEGPSSIYTKERQKLHDEIEREILAPDKIHSAKPPEGEKPTFMMLGGRGGSGKSWFQNNIYDPDKFVILDADTIKEKIPEYDGWNANQVHEESSDILEEILQKCLEQGLNVVMDATMKTPEKATEKLAKFIAKGYKTEAHYMHLPRQEAAKRAVMRYRNGKKEGDYKGRYVPVKVVLGMITNEETFDLIKNMVDSWSFRDNNVKRGEQPILISESKKSLKKSLEGVDFFLKKADDKDGGKVMEKNTEAKEMTREEVEKYYNDPDNWEYDCRIYEGDAAKLNPHTEEFMNGLFKEAGVPLE
jgi:predicted kinase